MTDELDALVDFGNVISEIHEKASVLTGLAHGFEVRRLSTKATRFEVRSHLRRMSELMKQAKEIIAGLEK